MVGRPPRRVALLSIHPRHADNILDGKKRVELRRVPISDDTSHVVIYATSPVREVVGWFEVDGVDRASCTAIWKAHGDTTGVTRQEFRDYFAGAGRACAIRVAQAHRLSRAVSLDTIPGVKRPPQSFQYLDPTSVSWLFEVRASASV